MTAPWIAAFILLWAVVLLLLFLQLGQLRRTAEVLEQSELRLRGTGLSPASMGLPPGSGVPSFEVPDAGGVAFAPRSQLGRRSIYLFLEGGCEPCRALVSDVNRYGGWDVPDIDLIAVIEGEEADVADPSGTSRVLPNALVVAEAFRTSATPHAFAVDERGIVVEKSIPNTLDELRALAEVLTAHAPSAAGGASGR